MTGPAEVMSSSHCLTQRDRFNLLSPKEGQRCQSWLLHNARALSTSKIEKLHFINSQPGACVLIQAWVSGTISYSRRKAVPHSNYRYPTGKAVAAFKP